MMFTVGQLPMNQRKTKIKLALQNLSLQRPPQIRLSIIVGLVPMSQIVLLKLPQKREVGVIFWHKNMVKRQKSRSTSRYVLCMVSVQYPTVVALHCCRQCIPPIAISSVTRYREQVFNRSWESSLSCCCHEG